MSAIRKGNRYCSAWCGHGCTWEEFDQATRDAAALVETLGRALKLDWTPEVHENLGWYARASVPHFAVSLDRGRGRSVSYSAMISRERDSHGGHWAGHGATPQTALFAALAEARGELNDMRSLAILEKGAGAV